MVRARWAAPCLPHRRLPPPSRRSSARQLARLEGNPRDGLPDDCDGIAAGFCAVRQEAVSRNNPRPEREGRMTARVRKSATRRRLLGVFGVLALAAIAAVVYVQLASANASVTTQGSATENADQANAGTYVTISNIVVTEGANTDFGSNTGGAWPATSFVLTPPANWQFQAG